MIDDLLEQISKRAALIRIEGDYIQNTILHCGVCKEPKQMIVRLPNGKKIVPAIQCRCQREAEEKEKLQLFESNKKARKEQLLKGIIKTEKFADCVFENDDNRQPEATVLCKKYVKVFKEIRKKGYGIMFYGSDNGKGKSFYSLCIANALIDKGYPVLFSTMNNLVANRISAIHSHQQPISVKDYDLVIVDDIGVENASPTAFAIIDEIYSNKIPLIVTTNLVPSQMKNNEVLEKRRIYDRLLEACTKKIHIQNSGSRLKKGNENLKDMLDILG